MYKEALEKIKVLLGMETSETKLATSKLKDSETVVEYASLEVGEVLYVVTVEGEGEEAVETKTPAPEGTHELEDGTKVTVDAEGVITEVIMVEEEETEEEAVEAKKEFKKKFYSEEGESNTDWIIDYLWSLENTIYNLNYTVEGLATANAGMSERLAKVEGALAAMFGTFEAVVKDVDSTNERLTAIEGTPGGKNVFKKDVKETKTNTRLENFQNLVKELRK